MSSGEHTYELGTDGPRSILVGVDGSDTSLRRLLERARPTHPEARLVVRRGDPFTVLTAVAGEVRADAVVVGASTRVGHRLGGSLAVRLVRAGRWPVIVVP